MSAPLWQFWTDETIKALGILATLLVVAVAIFRERLSYRFAPPQLKIALAGAGGMSADLYIYNPATRGHANEGHLVSRPS
jgi:hypothetical protein